jgi:hypothetical protein
MHQLIVLIVMIVQVIVFYIIGYVLGKLALTSNNYILIYLFVFFPIILLLSSMPNMQIINVFKNTLYTEKEALLNDYFNIIVFIMGAFIAIQF